MLAQNFKTPTDLQISDAEFEALVKVLGMLERQELIYSDVGKNLLPIPNGFNMGTWEQARACGTARCIGGWAAFLMKVDVEGYVIGARCSTLNELFWGCPNDNKATTAQASIALRNYLTHGEPRWAEAMAE